MANKRRYWMALSAAALAGMTGCSTAGFSMWPSTWFGGSSTPRGLEQYQARNTPPANPSKAGANAQLGGPAPPAPGMFSSISSTFKSWTSSGDEPSSQVDDPLDLENKPKQLSPELHVQMARMYEEKQNYAGAVKQYEQALKISPGNTDILVGLARVYDRKGEPHKAIEVYQQAIKADPRCALAHNDLGLCFARQRDLARSRESLMRAVSLAPTSKLYRNNLATVCVEAGQYHEAYEQLAAVNPPAIAQYNLGILANRKGDKAEALRRFQLAAALDASLAQAERMIEKLGGGPPHAAPPRDGQWVMHSESQIPSNGQAALRDAEAKIRAWSQSQGETAPIEPSYGSRWVPPGDDDITPIQPGEETRYQPSYGRSSYSISDEPDDVPVLLPPTGE